MIDSKEDNTDTELFFMTDYIKRKRCLPTKYRINKSRILKLVTYSLNNGVMSTKHNCCETIELISEILILKPISF